MKKLLFGVALLFSMSAATAWYLLVELNEPAVVAPRVQIQPVKEPLEKESSISNEGLYTHAVLNAVLAIRNDDVKTARRGIYEAQSIHPIGSDDYRRLVGAYRVRSFISEADTFLTALRKESPEDVLLLSYHVLFLLEEHHRLDDTNPLERAAIMMETVNVLEMKKKIVPEWQRHQISAHLLYHQKEIKKALEDMRTAEKLLLEKKHVDTEDNRSLERIRSCIQLWFEEIQNPPALKGPAKNIAHAAEMRRGGFHF